LIFTPLALALEISPILPKTLTPPDQVPSQDSIENELMSKLAVKRLAVKSINVIRHTVKSSLNMGPVCTEQQLNEALAAHDTHYHNNLLSMMVLNQDRLHYNKTWM
jgi:hypothetical protein